MLDGLEYSESLTRNSCRGIEIFGNLPEIPAGSENIREALRQELFGRADPWKIVLSGDRQHSNEGDRSGSRRESGNGANLK